MKIWQRIFNPRIVLLLLIVGFIFLYLQIKDGKYSNQDYQTYNQYQLMTQGDCDLVEAGCQSYGDDINVLLTFQSSPSALKPFVATLVIESPKDMQSSDVKLSFEMQGMDMGEQSFKLDFAQSTGRWEGEVILPICTSGRSDWLVISEITQGDSIYTSNHSFRLN